MACLLLVWVLCLRYRSDVQNRTAACSNSRRWPEKGELRSSGSTIMIEESSLRRVFMMTIVMLAKSRGALIAIVIAIAIPTLIVVLHTMRTIKKTWDSHALFLPVQAIG